MTLKEKFKKTLQKNFTINEIEEIADQFAIGFAEWYLNLYESDDADTFCKNNMNQLLEIYKKEKGL